MKKFGIAVLAVVVAAWMIYPTVGFSKPEFAKKEGNAPCTTCHVKAGQKDLNDVGKCYKDKLEKPDLKACQAAKK